MFIVQRNGVGARRFDSRAQLLAEGIEVDERMFRCAEGPTLLHRTDTTWVRLQFYRSGALIDVMVFAKPRQPLGGLPPNGPGFGAKPA